MSRYHDAIVAAAFKAGNQLPHWKIARIYFEDAMGIIQEKEHEWQQMDDDAEAGNLPEWTDE